MKKFLLFFLFASLNIFAQINTKPTQPLVKDAYFKQNIPPNSGNPTQKIHLIHADIFGKDPAKFEGNPFFSGNVQFEHQGSFLSADQVILYEDQNFAKAIGNARLQNPDGSVITSDEMEYDGNTQRGIARNHVVLTDPKQTIKTETLYYDKVTNEAYFNTGGTISDAQSTMYTKSAKYFVSTKMIDFTGNVRIDNGKYTVDGINILQNQNTNTATFNGPTTIHDKKDPSIVIYTEKGDYNQNSKEVYLNKNSSIHYKGKVLTGDKMYFNQNTGFGKANGNVLLRDPKENRFIKGGYGEIFEKKDSAMITEKPYAVKIFKNDSMFFSAQKILAYQKPDSSGKKKLSFLRGFKKARMFKSNAQARCDSLSFNETDGILHLDIKPILWSGEKQVSGDKIEAYFDTDKENIDSLKVIGNAFAISKADSLNLKDEFNQIKGKLMVVYYKENEIRNAKSIGNAQAITYADEENKKHEMERLGVSLSSCGVIEAEFEERKIQIISCNIGALTDIYPMSKISKKERFFPDFNWNTKDRPKKWTDIFLDSPNNEETKYTSDNTLYEKVQEAEAKLKAKEEAKKPKRVKK